MTKPTTDASPLSSRRAFVLLLRADADPRRGALAGRIEHVPTGRVLRFQSCEELLAFLADTLDSVRDVSRSPLAPIASALRAAVTARRQLRHGRP